MNNVESKLMECVLHNITFEDKLLKGAWHQIWSQIVRNIDAQISDRVFSQVEEQL